MPPSKNKVAQSLQKDIADPIYDDFATFIQAMPVLLPFCQAWFKLESCTKQPSLPDLPYIGFSFKNLT